MAKLRDLPTIVGKGLRKGLAAGRTKRIFGDGRDLYIVWLKKQFNTGDVFEISDIDKIDAHIHFSDKESLQLTINVMQKMLEEWEGEQNG